MNAVVADHVGLSVRDIDAQAGFYGQAFGLDEIVERFAMPEAEIRTLILRNKHGLKVELIERAGSAAREFADPFDAARTQGFFHLALDVDDLDERFAHALDADAQAVSWPAPAVRPGARFAYIKDPEGNLVELIQPAAADDSKDRAQRPASAITRHPASARRRG